MKRNFFYRLVKDFSLFVFLLIVSFTVKAQGIDNTDIAQSPYFVVITDNPDVDALPLKETSVDASIAASIADVTVRQVYVNTGKNPLEAIYTFPMSTRAAVYSMQMTIGKRTITAQIEEKNKARNDYEKAKSEGKRASLLEQSRPNVFTMNVSNIMVGDTVVVELKYSEILVPESGVYSFVYPTVVGPRYSGKESGGGYNDNFVSSPYTHQGEKPTYKFDYHLDIHAPIPIQDITCTSHKMNLTSFTLYDAEISLDLSETDGGDRDVIVSYSLKGKNIESGMLLYEGKDENFFMLMAQPSKKVNKSEIPPREYIFIVDVSGSMHGFPIDVSKKLMKNLLLGLKPTDKFNVITFASGFEIFSPSSVSPITENIDKAFYFIDKVHGWGGTEVLQALEQAYALPRPEENISRTMVIVTDGYVDVERKCFEKIRNNNDNANLFAFGIGESVNRYLIEGMAFAGNGEPMIVTNENEAAAQAEKFRTYISTPVLSRIKFKTDGFQAYDIEPATVPDMMAERPILIFGKYKGKPQGTITLSGNTGRKQFSQVYDMSKVYADSSNSVLRYLWARERIKYLDYLVGKRNSRRMYNQDSTIQKTITELGLKYNLMTEYTSFVAIDEEIVNKDGKMVKVKQPLPLPEGVSDRAIGNGSNPMNGVSLMSRANLAKSSNEFVSVGIEEDEVGEEEVFMVVENDPEFPGGLDSLVAFIQRNLKYPQLALDNKIQGKVYLSFVVEKDGHVDDIKILKDIGGGCGAEAVRVVKSMPKWKPGTSHGRPVRVQYNLPINFTLPSSQE